MTLIGRDDAMRLVGDAAKYGKNVVETLDLASKINDLEDAKIEGEDKALERKDIREMRRSWSKWILRAILVIIAFDLVIVFFAGFGWMKFEGVILPIFIGESLIQVLGLAVIIVGFLFNKSPRR